MVVVLRAYANSNKLSCVAVNLFLVWWVRKTAKYVLPLFNILIENSRVSYHLVVTTAFVLDTAANHSTPGLNWLELLCLHFKRMHWKWCGSNANPDSIPKFYVIFMEPKNTKSFSSPRSKQQMKTGVSIKNTCWKYCILKDIDAITSYGDWPICKWWWCKHVLFTHAVFRYIFRYSDVA